MITKHDIAHATMSPTEITFSVGDHIKAYGSTRHYGRTATILKVGRKRLTVYFHDKEGGHYVNQRNAHLIVDAAPARDPPVRHTIADPTSPRIDDNTKATEARSVDDLTGVLEQLAITTATAIYLAAPGERDALFHAFVHSLDQNLGGAPRHSTAVAVTAPNTGLATI